MTLASWLAGVNGWSLWRQRVRVYDTPMRATSLDRLIYLALHRVRLMGRAETQFFRARLKPGMTVVDVGANLGVYTVLFSHLVGPAGKVFAFEPHPRLFAALAEHCSGLTNVTPVRAAVGAQREQRSLRTGYWNSGDNRLVVDSVAGARDVIVTDVVTLDEYVGTYVDFVKIDVQGWEHQVFRGMSGVLGHVPVFFEFWPHGLRQVGTDPGALLRFVADAGYVVTQPDGSHPDSAVDPQGLLRRLGRRGYVNLFAVPRVSSGLSGIGRESAGQVCHGTPAPD